MRIAMVQSSLVWGNVEDNLKNFDRKLSESLQCDVVLLPEMFVSGCMMVKKSPEVAIAEKNMVGDRFAVVRSEMLLWAERQDALLIGSTVYREEGKFYNRLLVAFPDGRCLYYDKRHCFRMGGENEHFSAGSEQLVFEFRGVRIATFVCYDLRFPVWSRNTRNYDVAVYVANWPKSRREVWTTLLRARAIENQAYVAGVNCVGIDANGLEYAGDSMLVDARGRIVQAAAEHQEEIVTADCNVMALREFRQKFPVLEDRDNFLMC